MLNMSMMTAPPGRTASESGSNSSRRSSSSESAAPASAPQRQVVLLTSDSDPESDSYSDHWHENGRHASLSHSDPPSQGNRALRLSAASQSSIRSNNPPTALLPTPSSSVDHQSDTGAPPSAATHLVSDSDDPDISLVEPPRRQSSSGQRRRRGPSSQGNPQSVTVIDISDLSSDDILHDRAPQPLGVRMPRPDDLSAFLPGSSSASRTPTNIHGTSASSRRSQQDSMPSMDFSDHDDMMDIDLASLDLFAPLPHLQRPTPHTPPRPSAAAATAPSPITVPDTPSDDGRDALGTTGAGYSSDTDIRILPPTQVVDPVIAACGEVLTMFPDIEPAFLKQFVANLSNPQSDPAELAAVAVNSLLERKEPYPRINKELLANGTNGTVRKRKRDGQASDSGDDDADSDSDGAAGDRGVVDMSPGARKRRKLAKARRRGKGPDLRQHQPNLQLTDQYRSSCLHVLQSAFPTVPMSYIQTVLARHKGQYVLCHEALELASAANPPPFKAIRARRVCTHGRCGMDPLVKEHVDWLSDIRKLEHEAVLAAKRAEEELERAKQSGEALECGCCFDTYLPRDLASCLDGHLFCLECLRSALSASVGDRKTNLTCMSMDVCDYGFARSELVRACKRDNPKLLKAWDRLMAETSVRNAEIDGLVLCPYCDYGAVTVEGQTVFACEACGKESCVRCRQEPHVPLTCDEAEKKKLEDDKLSLKHRVEEEMTNALVRTCPKCGLKSYKVEGCNKMTCTCGQVMCYVCRQPIRDYSHFDQSARSNIVGKDGKCPLWDDTVQRNHAEVDEAEKRALEALRREKGDEAADLDAEDLNIGGVAGRAPPPPAQSRAPAFPNFAGMGPMFAGGLPRPAPPAPPARINLDEHMARIRQLAQRMPPPPAPAPGAAAAAAGGHGVMGMRRLPPQQPRQPPPDPPQVARGQQQAAAAPAPERRRKYRRR